VNTRINLLQQDVERLRFLERVFKAMPVGILWLNSNNVIESINEAALKILDLRDQEELEGLHIREIYCYPDDAGNVFALLEDTDMVKNVRHTFKKSASNTFCGLYTLTKVSSNGSEKTVMFIQDISEQQKTEERLQGYAMRLEKNNKELDQFAYIVSHDLKAPLRAISNLAAWLYEDLGESLSGDNKHNLEMLRGRVLRMESLVNGILEYSRAGRQASQSETIDVAELLHEVHEMISPPAHIEVKWSATMPVLDAPRTPLLQVFSNIIGNAIKYNDKAKCLIEVTALETSELCEFIVEDNGPGIEKEYHEKIFQLFQTLQPRDRVESTGIGLTIVKRIIEDLGGTIRVESETHRGSKFIFSLPRNRKLTQQK
jgi:PAS domain S-box-containing protein